MMKSRKKVVIKQKLTKIFFTLAISFSLSSAYAADPKIPTVDDVNREIPNVKKDLKRYPQPGNTFLIETKFNGHPIQYFDEKNLKMWR